MKQATLKAVADTRTPAGSAYPARPVIERWDGRAAERIAALLCDGARSG